MPYREGSSVGEDERVGDGCGEGNEEDADACDSPHCDAAADIESIAQVYKKTRTLSNESKQAKWHALLSQSKVASGRKITSTTKQTISSCRKASKPLESNGLMQALASRASEPRTLHMAYRSLMFRSSHTTAARARDCDWEGKGGKANIP